jgi:transketolase
MGDAVLQVFAGAEVSPRIVRLAVTEMPTSGSPSELLGAAGIDAEHIADAARKLAATPIGASLA